MSAFFGWSNEYITRPAEGSHSQALWMGVLCFWVVVAKEVGSGLKGET